MTVSNSINKHIYQGNGQTTEFPFTFPLLDESHLSAYLTYPGDQAPVFLDPSYYAVKDGYVEYLPGGAPLPNGYTLTLVRQVPLTQETDLTNSGGFHADVLETGYDKLTMITQQLSEELSRAIKMPISSTESGDELTEAVLTNGSNIIAAAAEVKAARDNIIDIYNHGLDGNIVYLEPDDNGDLMPADEATWGRGLPLPLMPPEAGDAGCAVIVKDDRTGYTYGAKRLKLVCLGDSITAGAPFYTGATPPTEEQDVYSWVRFIRDRVTFDVINKGIGGHSSRLCKARFEADVADEHPSHCIIAVGINDALSLSAPVPHSEFQENVDWMVNACWAHNITPILMLPIPTRNATNPAITSAMHDACDLNREWLAAYAESHGIPMIDGYNAFLRATTKAIITGFYSEDGLHPHVRGYQALGEVTLLAVLGHVFQGVLSTADRKILFTNLGQSYNRDYQPGDLLFNASGTEGQWAFFSKFGPESGDTEGKYTWMGSLRNTLAKGVNYVGCHVSTDLSDKYWQIGDVIIKYHPDDKKCAIWEVTKAGFTGRAHVGLPDACEVDLLCEFATGLGSGADAEANLVGAFNSDDASNRYWNVGDIILKNWVAEKKLAIWRVTGAGYTGSAYVGQPEACTVELVCEVKTGTDATSQPGWTYPTLENGWVNTGGIWASARYYKDLDGRVHLDGFVSSGSPATTIFTLPAGCRPSHATAFPSLASGAFASLVVYADGRVQQAAGASGASISLSSISFRAS